MEEKESIAALQEQIIDSYSFLDDWMDKYAQIIEEGKRLSPYPEEFRTDEYKVQGCVSQVWLHAHQQGERVYFLADSDAAITKGLISLLLKVYSGQKAGDILTHPPVFLEKMELGKHLSPNRSNGLVSMVRDLRNYATAFEQLQQSKIQPPA